MNIKRKGKQLSLYISDAEYEKLEQACSRTMRNKTDVLRELIRLYL